MASTMEKVREELICAVCLDFLREPKVLLCAHSFCLECLQRIVTTQNAYRQSDSDARYPNTQGKELECPSCRHVSELPGGKAANLKTNYNLKRLVDIVSDEKKRRARDSIRVWRSQKPKLDRSRQPLCRFHKKPMEFFCVDCSELLCSKCMVSGHKEHNYQDVEEILPAQISALRNLIQPACEVASRAETHMEELYHERDVVATNGKATTDSIRLLFNKMRTSLNSREKALLDTVQKYTDVKLTKLDTHYQKLEEDRKAVLKIVDTIAQLVQHTQDVTLLTEQQAINEELDLHQQSILGIVDSSEDRDSSSRFLTFKGNHSLLRAIENLGDLSECRREANTVFLTARRIIVTEDEDPYLDVPLRFEDDDVAGKKTASGKPGVEKPKLSLSELEEEEERSCYDIPRPLPPQQKLEIPTKQPPPSPPTEGKKKSSQKRPPVSPKPKFPSRPVRVPSPPPHSTKPPPPLPKPRANLRPPLPSPPLQPKWPGDVRPRSPSPPLKPKPGANVRPSSPSPPPPPRPPKPDSETTVPKVPPRDSKRSRSPNRDPNVTQSEVYDVPRSLSEDLGEYDTPRHWTVGAYNFPRHSSAATYGRPQLSAMDTYDSPRLSLMDTYDSPRLSAMDTYDSPRLFSTDTYDTPRLSASDTYDTPRPKPSLLPRPRPLRSSTISVTSLIESSDDEDYDPVFDLMPVAKPRKKPPPLPPEHPTRAAKPVPKQRNGAFANSYKESRSPISPPGGVTKKRAVTLPPGLSMLPEKDALLEPVMVIGKAELSSSSGKESVYPCGVCCSSDDTLVVTDVFNHCLRFVDSQGKLVETIGREGRGSGHFKEPSAVVVTPDGHILVAERDNPRVQKFKPNRKYQLKFGQKVLWGSQLSDPVGLTVNSNGNIYVSDWDKSTIFVFNPSGKLLFNIQPKETELRFPAGIAFDNRGRLLVTDRKNHCVRMFTPTGDYIGQISSEGTKPGQLFFPYGIAVTPASGNIIVAESGNDRVSVFSPSGDFLECFGDHGSEPGMFNHPRHVCMNSKGQIVVADEMNQRIQVFQYVP